MKKLLFFAALFYSSSVFAQPSPSGSPDVPIDGGVSLLVAAGIGYGAKKIKDARKKRKESELEN